MYIVFLCIWVRAVQYKSLFVADTDFIFITCTPSSPHPLHAWGQPQRALETPPEVGSISELWVLPQRVGSARMRCDGNVDLKASPTRRIWVLKGDRRSSSRKQGRAMSRKQGSRAGCAPPNTPGQSCACGTLWEASRIQRWLPPALRTRTGPPGSSRDQAAICFSTKPTRDAPAGRGWLGCARRVGGAGPRLPGGYLGRPWSIPGPLLFCCCCSRCEEAADREAKHVEGRALLPIKLQTVSQEKASKAGIILLRT